MCSRPRRGAESDPDKGDLVMFLMTRMAPGAPRTQPADVRVAAETAEPGVVLTQEIRVLSGVQRGMHQPGLTHLVLSSEERRVINMHRYLGLPESEGMRGAAADESSPT